MRLNRRIVRTYFSGIAVNNHKAVLINTSGPLTFRTALLENRSESVHQIPTWAAFENWLRTINAMTTGIP